MGAIGTLSQPVVTLTETFCNRFKLSLYNRLFDKIHFMDPQLCDDLLGIMHPGDALSPISTEYSSYRAIMRGYLVS